MGASPDEAFHASEDRLRRQNTALAELARARMQRHGDVRAALGAITEAASRALEIERVSVWVFKPGRSRIRCLDLYQRSVDFHSEGVELAARNYPTYFEALEDAFTIAAHNARTDPRTREFTDHYLGPLGITSMLDAPMRLADRLVGVVCHEHVGPPRHWTLDEQNFAGSIADLASLAIEEAELKQAEILKTTFAELGHRLSAAATPKAAAEIIVDLAFGIWGWDACSLCLFPAEENRIVPVLDCDTLNGKRVDLTDESGEHGATPIMRRVARGGAKLLLRRKRPQPHAQLIPFGDRERMAPSSMHVPIRNGRKVVGVLSIQSYRPKAYDAEALRGLQALGDHCAGALERIHAGQALRESERRFASFMKNTKVLAWMKDSNFNYAYVNPPFERVHGVRLAALRDKGDSAFLASAVAAELRRNDETVLNTGKPLEIYETVPGRDGRRRDWWVYKFPFLDAAGRRFVGGMAVDITERRQAEEAVRSLSRRILEAGEAERRRVARELHDSANQLLAAARFRLQSISGRMPPAGAHLAHEVIKARELVGHALREVRRISRNLRPSELDDLGLVSALRSLCDEFADRVRMAVELKCAALPRPCSADMELTLYRIVQEALSNVEKHASAKRVMVSLTRENGCFRLSIKDDGKGFSSPPARRRKGRPPGFGLVSIRERAAFIGAEATVDSARGRGTEISVCLRDRPAARGR